MKRNSIFHSVSIKRTKNDLSLSKGLAYTPAQMFAMARDGKPISSENIQLDSYFDGETDLAFQPLPERQRGVDPVHLWNIEQDIKKKGRKAYQTALDAVKIQQSQQS